MSHRPLANDGAIIRLRFAQGTANELMRLDKTCRENRVARAALGNMLLLLARLVR